MLLLLVSEDGSESADQLLDALHEGRGYNPSFPQQNERCLMALYTTRVCLCQVA